jgi:hypothetical protein
MVKKWNDSSKKIIRPYIVKRESGKVAKAAIFMPADTCLCVSEALAQGTINCESKLLIVDRNRAVLGRAFDKLVEMGFHQDEIYMFCGNLQDCSIEQFHNSSGKSCNECIGFIYLDTCSELTESTYKFIKKFLKDPNICKQCTIAFTFSNAERASRDFLWGIAKTKDKFFSNKVDKDCAKFFDFSNDKIDNPSDMGGKKYYTALRCSMINNALNKIIGKTHMLAVGRGYKEQGPSVPMFTARYEPKRITHFRKYDKLVPKNLGYKS